MKENENIHPALVELSSRFRIPVQILDEAGVRHKTDAAIRELLGSTAATVKT
jgi:hypothetical protein